MIRARYRQRPQRTPAWTLREFFRLLELSRRMALMEWLRGENATPLWTHWTSLESELMRLPCRRCGEIALKHGPTNLPRGCLYKPGTPKTPEDVVPMHRIRERGYR